MALSFRFSAAWLCTLAAGTLLGAQTPLPGEPPPLHVSIHPPSKKDRDYREALRLYARGLMEERDNRFLEAVTTFEQALALDSEAIPVLRSLVPLYLALDRTEQALKSCERVLQLDPEDCETWYVLARQHRSRSRSSEAIASLTRLLKCRSLADRPDLHAQAAFDLAVLCEQSQEFAEAEAALQEVARVLDNTDAVMERTALTREEVDGQAVEAYERLGQVSMKAKHFDAARAAFEKAQARIGPQDRVRVQRVSYNLAQVYQAQGRPADALRYLDQYLNTQPQGTEGYELQIALLRQVGRASDVIPTVKRHFEADSHNNALRELLARTYAENGQLADAEREFKALVQEEPTPAGYRGLFRVYQQQGRSDVIFNELDRALAAVNPENGRSGSAKDAACARSILIVLRDEKDMFQALLPLARQRLLVSGGARQRGDRAAQPRPDTVEFLASLAIRAHLLDDAEFLYRSCLDMQPPQPQFGRRSSEGDIYVGLLRVLLAAHKHEAILEICDRGLEHAAATNRTLFRARRTQALLSLGRLDEALTEADLTVDVSDPANRVYARTQRAHILAAAERFDQAMAECEALLKDYTEPKDVHQIRITYAFVCQQARAFAKAEEQMQKVLDADPADASANNSLGYFWADENKNLDQAEKLIRKAIELDQQERRTGVKFSADADHDNAAYIDSLGWVLFRKGRLDDARRELEKAAALPDGVDDPVVWDHLGDVYARMEQPARARTAWQKAIDLYEKAKTRPRDAQYRDIKEKLKLQELDSHP
jgi:tetratricopeptide (TPR) repeat protein